MIFANVEEVERAYSNNELELGTKITVRIKESILDKETNEMAWKKKRFETTVGRAILSKILPPGLPFDELNKALKKKEISSLINSSLEMWS